MKNIQLLERQHRTLTNWNGCSCFSFSIMRFRFLLIRQHLHHNYSYFFCLPCVYICGPGISL